MSEVYICPKYSVVCVCVCFSHSHDVYWPSICDDCPIGPSGHEIFTLGRFCSTVFITQNVYLMPGRFCWTVVTYWRAIKIVEGGEKKKKCLPIYNSKQINQTSKKKKKKHKWTPRMKYMNSQFYLFSIVYCPRNMEALRDLRQI